MAAHSNQTTGTGGGTSTTATGTGTTASTSTATASVANPQTAAAQSITAKKQAYQSSNNPTAKATIVTTLMQQLNRANVVNPATNQPYTQAELEAELSR
jgi:hypothetical protein